MYGMIPRAKMVKRDSAPPENMLNMPRMPPCWPWNSSASTFGSMPGHRDVRADAEHHQRRRAGTAAAASGRRSARPCRRWEAPSPSGLGALAALALPQRSVGPSSSLLGLLGRFRLLGDSMLPPAASITARAPLVRLTLLQRDLALELARRGSPWRPSALRDTTPAALSAARSISVAFMRLQVADAHLGDIVARGRLEAALGQAAMQRHLAALEADLVEAAGARALALVAAARGLAPARAARRGRRGGASCLAPGAGLRVLSRMLALDAHQVADLVDHAAHRRGVDQLDRRG